MNQPDHGSASRASRRNVAVALAVAAAVVAVDQATKAWAVRALDDGHIVDVLGPLRFKLAFNTGASFSIGSGLGPVFAVVVVVVVVLLLRFVRHVHTPVGLVAVGAVIGGALGNLVDRVLRDDDGILRGGVVDFIDVQFWPIFNVADIGVVVGALVLVLVSWREAAGEEHDEDRGVEPAIEPNPEAGPGSGS